VHREEERRDEPSPEPHTISPRLTEGNRRNAEHHQAQGGTETDRATPIDLLERHAVLPRGAAPTPPGAEAASAIPYLHMRVSTLPPFRPHGPDVLEATESALAPRTWEGIAYQWLRRHVLGRRLSTAEQSHERLSKVKALAVFSSDAISSVAYSTEASLGILFVAGAAALRYNLMIAGCIAVLLLVVGSSYWQPIHAYPKGGSSYIVTRANLGELPGLIAAAALLIDHVHTVSVSVSSGVDALASAVPAAHPFSVLLGVTFNALIMLGNLRGIRESGPIFAAPTHLFIAAFLVMIGAGAVRAALRGGVFAAEVPTPSPQALSWGTERPSILLVAG
jgi:hypothetical protein